MNIFSNFSFQLPLGEKVAEGIRDNISLKETTFLHPLPFETLDLRFWDNFLTSYWFIPCLIGALYLVTIFSFKAFMSNRKPFQLNTELFLWNAGIGLFSIIGFLRAAPELVDSVSQFGLHESICNTNTMSISQLFWGFAFLLSKIVELGDTVFIVARKRPLVFLQWYHHVVTMIFTWVVYPYMEPISMWYGALNLGVHSLMYPYFAVKALHMKTPSWVPKLIVTLQLAQMYAAVALHIYTMVQIGVGNECRRHAVSMWFSTIIYGSFAFIFGKLYFTVTSKHGATKEPAKKEL